VGVAELRSFHFANDPTILVFIGSACLAGRHSRPHNDPNLLDAMACARRISANQFAALGVGSSN